MIWIVELRTSSEFASCYWWLESDEFILRLNSSFDGIDYELQSNSLSVRYLPDV